MIASRNEIDSIACLPVCVWRRRGGRECQGIPTRARAGVHVWSMARNNTLLAYACVRPRPGWLRASDNIPNRENVCRQKTGRHGSNISAALPPPRSTCIDIIYLAHHHQECWQPPKRQCPHKNILLRVEDGRTGERMDGRCRGRARGRFFFPFISNQQSSPITSSTRATMLPPPRRAVASVALCLFLYLPGRGRSKRASNKRFEWRHRRAMRLELRGSEV